MTDLDIEECEEWVDEIRMLSDKHGDCFKLIALLELQDNGCHLDNLWPCAKEKEHSSLWICVK